MSENTVTNTNIIGKNRCITGFNLKIVAIVSMVADHLAAVLLKGYISTIPSDNPGLYNDMVFLYQLLRCIGRLAFPIFVFLLVEGFIHTSSKGRYAMRLLAFALISEVPFDIAFKSSIYDLSYQNVFFTLLMGFLFMCISEIIYQITIIPVLGYLGIILGTVGLGSYFGIFCINLLEKYGISFGSQISVIATCALFSALVLAINIHVHRLRSFNELCQASLSMIFLALFMYMADILRTDYGAFGLLAIATAYCFRSNYQRSFALSLVPLILSSPIEAFALLNILLIRYYDGTQGKKVKYFFYIFYPAHILVIAFIAYLMGYLQI